MDENIFEEKKQLLESILVDSSEEEIATAILTWKTKDALCADCVKYYETQFKCIDCSSSKTHLICQKCFYNGNHNGHTFGYFNNMIGGTCDCGDPSKETIITCKDHFDFSEKALNDAERLVSEKHRGQIEQYFRDQFQRVFENLETSLKQSLNLDGQFENLNDGKEEEGSEENEQQSHDSEGNKSNENNEDNERNEGNEENDNDDSINKSNSQISEKQIDDLFNEINVFIQDNPGGCLILSKVIMKPISSFRCHHLCSRFADENQFDKFSRSRRECSCSIMKNLFRYLKCYRQEVEDQIKSTLCRFFSNFDFKKQLILVFSEMIHFLYAAYNPVQSSFFQIFCQFNSFKSPDLKSQLIIESPLFLSCLSKSLDIKNNQFMEPICQNEFFELTLSFFVKNKQAQNNWETKSNLLIRILQAISSSTKTNNYGVFFIDIMLQLDSQFIDIVIKIFQLIQKLSESTQRRIMIEIISGMLDQIVLFRKKDELFKDNMIIVKDCIELETQIFSFLKANSQSEAIQFYVNNNLNNLVIPKLNEDEGIKIERMISYKVELVAIFDKLQEIITQNLPKENFIANSEEDNISQLKKVFAFLNNEPKLNRLSSVIQFSECNQCPLFNNQYRILALALSQLYLQANSIQEAKQIINSSLDSEHSAILEEVLLYSINQLAQTMEYLRHHQEKVMGFNDYEVLIAGLPGRDSDLVAIQRIYMSVYHNLFDFDVLALQTILPLVDTDKYFREFFRGFQLESEEIQIISESQESILKMKRFTKVLQWIIVILLDRVSFVNSLQFNQNGSQKWLQGYLDQIINVCFQFNNTYSLPTLKDQLKSLKVKEQVDLKSSLLSMSKIKDNKFQKLEDLKFIYDPMMFLREKEIHHMYIDKLSLSKLVHPEIEYIVGNQFLLFIQNSSFAKEIANSVCSSTVIGNAFMSIIKSRNLLSAGKLNNECLQYTLKFISIISQWGSNGQKDSLQLKRFLEEDLAIDTFLRSAKENNQDLSKSIKQIEMDWIHFKEEYFQSKETLNQLALVSTENQEENQANIFMKKAKEAQMKSLSAILQKQQKFYEKNKSEISEFSQIQNQDQDCLFCHDSQKPSLKLIQAYIEADNLDLYSNKVGRIPKGLTKRNIIYACTHISHLDCLITDIHLQGKTSEGQLCMQCKQQFNVYLPLLEPLLQPSIQFLKLKNDDVHEENQKNDNQFLKKSQFSVTLTQKQKMDLEDKIIQVVNAFMMSINNIDNLIDIRVVQECICFILSQVFDNGLSQFLSKSKMMSANLFLVGRVILHDILNEEVKKKVIEYTDNIVQKNLSVLSNINQFIHQFRNEEDAHFIAEHSYQDLPLLYAQTILYLALLPQTLADQQSAAAQILQLSEGVFNFACICNASVILSKSFSQDQKVSDLMSNCDFLDSLNDQNQKWKDIITATLLTIFSFEEGALLIELNESSKVEDLSKIEEIQITMFPFLNITSEIIGKAADIIYNKSSSQFSSAWTGQIKCLESPKFLFSDVGSNYFENYQRFFKKRCMNCNLYPRRAKSDIHLCLICGYQMCSNSCVINQDDKNLIIHAEKKHEGKTIFLNLIGNIIMVVSSPFSIQEGFLYFDSLNQPFEFNLDSFFKSNTWKDYKLNEKKLTNLKNILISRQVPSKLNYLIQSGKNQALQMF